MNKPERLGDDPPKDILDLMAVIHKMGAAIRKMGDDQHAIKGNMKAMADMQQLSLDKHDQSQIRQQATEKKVDLLTIKVDTQATRSEELLVAYETAKKGAGVMKTVGRWISNAAIWLLRRVKPVLVVVAITYGLYHGELPKWLKWLGEHE